MPTKYMTILKEAYKKRGSKDPMWKELPVKVAKGKSALVAQNEYGALIDLHLAGEALWDNIVHQPNHAKPFYDTQKYRYMVWSEMAFAMIAVVTEDEGRLMLTFMQPWDVTEVTLENVIQIAVLRWGRSGIWQCLD